MRNQRIVRAYDSINPSPAEKARMLDAILAEAHLEEAPRKTRKKKEPVIYTAKPTKTSHGGMFGAIAACIMVVIIAGFVLGFMLNRQNLDPAYAEPTTEEPVTTGTPYDAVLNKYKSALEEGWTAEKCEIEGISLRMQSGADFTKAGYAFLDLDGDGRDELLIAEESLPHIDLVWDLYTTLEDGTPIQLWVDERDGNQCYLYEGNIIGTEYTSKSGAEYAYYAMEAGKLVMREGLQYEDEDTVFYTDAQGNTKSVTSKEAQNVANSYEHQKLSLTWLADIPDYLRNTEAVEQYTPVLEKYRTALEEGWDRVMCAENDMSMLTPIESVYESLYYAMYDLNSDGVEELIISEYPYRENTDTAYIDIFTVVDGEVKNAMSMFELAGMRSLCEGGFVKDLFMEPGMEYDKYAGFLKLEGDRFVTDLIVYQKDNQWYTEGYRGVGAAITREEADGIVAQYPPLKLDFVEIQPSGETEYRSGYEGFDYVINKYVTALSEGWTEDQCMQNDISPEILDDTTITHNLGWCLLDIDGNGVEELIVSDGVELFDLYVMMPHDGGPGHIICAYGGESWQLCENGVISNRGLYSGSGAWRHYILVDTDIIQQDIVSYDGELNQYYYGANGEDLEPISKDDAGNLINRYRTAELTLTPFVEAAPFEPDETEYYEPLLDIYRQAIRENWNPGVCVENGISLMIGYYGDFVEELGYTLMDLDNNGIQELIVTDGTNIYDLYTIIQDEETGPLRLVDAMERIEYFLTTDGWIYCRGSGGAARSYHTLYALGERELDVLEGYAYDADTDPNNPWFYYDGVNVQEPCGRDVQSIIDSWESVHIPFTPFVEIPYGEVPANAIT